MSEDFNIEEIQYEVISEAKEFQPSLVLQEELSYNCSWKELSSTPLKVVRSGREEVDGEDVCRLKASSSFGEKFGNGSLTEIQTESTNTPEIFSESPSSQKKGAPSPLLFTPVKGENTYGAGYLTQNSASSILSINPVGSASNIRDTVFSTPPKSAKKSNLALTPSGYQPVNTDVKINCANREKINDCEEPVPSVHEVRQKEFHHLSLPSFNAEKDISYQKHFISQKYANPLPILSSHVENSDALASSCDPLPSGNCELQSYISSETRCCPIREDDTATKLINSSPSSLSLSTEAKKEQGLRTSVSLDPQKSSRVKPRTRRKHRLRTLLSRARHSLAGLPPPPSITVPRLTAAEMLEKLYKSEVIVSAHNSPSKSPGKNSACANGSIESLFHPSATEQEIMEMSWPDVLDCVHLGVCYNLGCSSEALEDLCQQVREKYVGNETASSCSIWSLPKLLEESNHKRSRISLANNVSREGYITRRRRAFSIASLTTTIPSVISKSRQILVNGIVKKPKEGKKVLAKNKREYEGGRVSKKEDNKHSLTKKCFGEKGKSAKKLSSIRRSLSFDECSGNDGHSSSEPVSSSLQTVSSLLPSTKRVLTFDSGAKASSMGGFTSDNMLAPNSSPSLPGSGESLFSSDSQDYRRNKSLSAASALIRELSEVHKKKLLWAVAQALRSRGLGTGHDKFKICAIPLFRHCRDEFLNATTKVKREIVGSSDGSDGLCPSVGSTDSQKESTSDKMLCIALGLVDRIMNEVGVMPVIKGRPAST